ncbi:hypothetical protein UFOVP300_12 [uncultured Caudovirales phage]|uniref:Uncharacterized protein n=1 Tax=uncultured Caudovirales phage TaxID=2100421 RepID=A0A6J5LNZ1_9CAUD|nr:hypothetical protein UFOVP300_12 [uncultured Caudovirales phage]
MQSANAGGVNLKISRSNTLNTRKAPRRTAIQRGKLNHKKSSNNKMSNTQLTQLVNTQVALGDMQVMANAIVKSGLFGMKTADQALALMIVATAEGRHPGSVASDYHIIQGRASLKSDSMLARFQQSGGRVEWHDHTNEKVSATFSHPAGGSLRIDWDMARAKAAGLGGKDNWRSYPRQMLRARVISEGVRATFPAVLNGMYTPEEVGEFDAPRTAPRSVKADPVVVVEQVIEAPVVVEPVAVPATPVIEAEVVSNDTSWADELDKCIFEHEPKVNAYLIAGKKIAEGQTFRDIPAGGYRDRVLANPTGFLEAALKVKEVA